ncbi:MAG: hypothetical protein IMZ62_12215 [Chloroflexi bacterium]|nr:hypothetical protein [Chloroflexota bacterium]
MKKTPGCNYNKEGGGAVLQNPPGDQVQAIQAVRAQAAIAVSRVRCGLLIEKPRVARLEIAAFHFPFGVSLHDLPVNGVQAGKLCGGSHGVERRHEVDITELRVEFAQRNPPTM